MFQVRGRQTNKNSVQRWRQEVMRTLRKEGGGGRAGLMDATPEAETRGQKGVGTKGVEGIEGSELYPKGCGKLMQGFEGQKD